MRRQLLSVLVSFACVLSLSGCNNAVFDDDSVIGPDLAGKGPFAAAHEVVMTQPFTYHAPGFAGVERIRRITLMPETQSASLVNVFTNTEKPFLAGVGYQTFLPVIAETNQEARSYWIIGFNSTRTPDRSTYMLLRYPRDLKIAPGLNSDAFEYISLQCDHLRTARRPPEFYAPRPEGTVVDEAPPEPVPAGDCEFNNLADVTKMSSQVLQRFDEIKRYDDAPKLEWQPLHVEVK